MFSLLGGALRPSLLIYQGKRGQVDGQCEEGVSSQLSEWFDISMSSVGSFEAKTDRAFDVLFSLARKPHLSLGDAAHLQLASRLRLPLAILDLTFRKAAGAAGVDLAGASR